MHPGRLVLHREACAARLDCGREVSSLFRLPEGYGWYMKSAFSEEGLVMPHNDPGERERTSAAQSEERTYNLEQLDLSPWSEDGTPSVSEPDC